MPLSSSPSIPDNITITIVIIIIIFVILQKKEEKALSWQTRAVRRQMKANCYKPEVWDWKGKFLFLQKREKEILTRRLFPSQKLLQDPSLALKVSFSCQKENGE